MTIEELRALTHDPARVLAQLADRAAADDDRFAPWVVLSLRRASFYAGLSEQALAKCFNDIDEAENAVEETR